MVITVYAHACMYGHSGEDGNIMLCSCSLLQKHFGTMDQSLIYINHSRCLGLPFGLCIRTIYQPYFQKDGKFIFCTLAGTVYLCCIQLNSSTGLKMIFYQSGMFVSVDHKFLIGPLRTPALKPTKSGVAFSLNIVIHFLKHLFPFELQ